MNGSVVATIDIPTAGNATGPTSFQSFDEYGVPETTTITNSTLQNFGWAGTANRQTETTGLILMGARVYNPVTGQFTSPDPIPGGNETTYTYPNDPINSSDYTGCIEGTMIVSMVGTSIVLLFEVAMCPETFGTTCVIALASVGGFTGWLNGMADGNARGLTGSRLIENAIVYTVVGTLLGPLGRANAQAIGRVVSKIIAKKGLSEIVTTGLSIKLDELLTEQLIKKYYQIRKYVTGANLPQRLIAPRQKYVTNSKHGKYL
jgi:RHS repeat-associated protein